MGLSLNANLKKAANGNLAAEHFLGGLYRAIQVWDDLEDGDDVTSKDANETFEFLLLYMPANPFYQQYLAQLLPVMRAALINWHTGNAQREAHKEQTYILRQMYFDVVTAVAAITGGLQLAKDVNLALWRESAEHLSLEAYREKE